MGKLTISMAMFNSYVKLPEGIAWVRKRPTMTHQLGEANFGARPGVMTKLISRNTAA